MVTYINIYIYLTQSFIAMLKHEKWAVFYGQKQRCWFCWGVFVGLFGFFSFFPLAASLFSAFDLSMKPGELPDLEVIS